jgi:hypothetical protein
MKTLEKCRVTNTETSNIRQLHSTGVEDKPFIAVRLPVAIWDWQEE